MKLSPALQPMLKSANCSEGCRVEFPGGNGWATWSGQPVDANYLQSLERQQALIRDRIDQAIRAKKGP